MTAVVVELRRALGRRMTRVLVLLAAAGIIAAGATVFARSSTDVQAARAEAKARQEREIDTCVAEEYPLPGEGSPGFDRRAACRRVIGRYVDDPRFHYADLEDIYVGTGVPLILGAWLLAASFIGAEWRAGTMTTLLTWDARRLVVMLAKAAAAAVICVVASLALQALLAVALLPAGLMRGTMAGTGWEWGVDTVAVTVRVAAVAGMAALMGFSIGSLGRNTAAALGVGFLYFGIVENLVRGLRPQWARWMLGDNAGVFILAEPIAFLPGRTTFEAAGLLTLYAVAMVTAAAAVFRVRDVT